jgi:hypothetical protein
MDAVGELKKEKRSSVGCVERQRNAPQPVGRVECQRNAPQTMQSQVNLKYRHPRDRPWV